MRFFYAPSVSPTHILDENESKHVVRVLRANEGDLVALTDGAGRLFQGKIEVLDKRQCVLETTLIQTSPPASPHLTLVIAPTKSTDRFEWLLEKAMEFGIRTIQPIWTDRSERKQEKQDRWQRILISALKQSQQVWLTDLRPACTWDEWLKQAPLGGFIAHCEPTVKPLLFHAISPGHDAWIAIGPEGDFTPKEIESALLHGAQAVSLGNQRLRSETAGLSVIQTFQLAQLTVVSES